jgi:DNA polymerase-4
VAVDLWARTPELPGLVLPEVAPAGPPILHVDADAFFVAVEERDDPALHGLPVVVGDELVCSASYEARRQGVRVGMLVNQALVRCPELVAVAPRWDVYTVVGAQLFDLLHEFGEIVEAASVEDAFVDLGIDDWDTATAAAHRVRVDARERLDLPVSVGVARTKLLAKIANRRAKPDGVIVISPDCEPRIRAALGIGELWGIGRGTRSKLKVQGIESVAELTPYSARELAPIVGTAMARRLYRIAHAFDDARVLPRRPRPNERTVVRRPVQLPLALDLN